MDINKIDLQVMRSLLDHTKKYSHLANQWAVQPFAIDRDGNSVPCIVMRAEETQRMYSNEPDRVHFYTRNGLSTFSYSMLDVPGYVDEVIKMMERRVAQLEELVVTDPPVAPEETPEEKPELEEEPVEV